MNANPASAASVAPALQSEVVRAPGRTPAAPTTLETFLSASALAEPLQSKVAVARLSTSIAFRSTLVARAHRSPLR
jgi:hypothetical protein